MGQQQSKGELLHQQVSYGNIEGIKALCREGAGLEWIDKEAKTPLITACMSPGLYNVAKTLIELGANVKAYRPGRHAGTPLHHAAKRGLEDIVNLLLSHGANALIMNDDCQSPLEVAREKGHTNVVRVIERHICLFSGWLREFYGPGFLEVLAKLVSRRVWVVVLPCGSRKPAKPFKLELAIYPSMQDARPRIVIALWKVNLEEPKFHQSDPSVVIHDNSTIPRGRRRRRSIYISQDARCRHQKRSQTRIKLASSDEKDKQQLQWFCNACKGIPEAQPAFLGNQPPVPATAPPPAEDLELAMAINASIQSALQERESFPDAHPTYEASASSSSDNAWGVSSSNNGLYNGCGAPTATAPPKVSSSKWSGNESGQGGEPTQHTEIQATIQTAPTSDIVPSAPPVADGSLDEVPVQYPSIDSSPIDIPSQSVESIPAKVDEKKGVSTSSCVICLDAPAEGACIPCGHMAGCMSCLSEIKGKKWGCPVCRAKIDQVIRLYAV